MTSHASDLKVHIDTLATNAQAAMTQLDTASARARDEALRHAAELHS